MSLSQLFQSERDETDCSSVTDITLNSQCNVNGKIDCFMSLENHALEVDISLELPLYEVATRVVLDSDF